MPFVGREPDMNKTIIISLFIIPGFFFCHALTGQVKKQPKLLIKGTFHCVFSLSDIDVNQRLNTYHIEPLVELQWEGEGVIKTVKKGSVSVNGVVLKRVGKKFRVRKILLKRQIPAIHLSVNLNSAVVVDRGIIIPRWIKLSSPKPGIYMGQDLRLQWRPWRLKIPVKLHAFNVMDSKTILPWQEATGHQFTIPGRLLPHNGLVRIVVMESEYHEMPLLGPGISARSGIRLLSRSQVLIRTR